MTYLELVNQVLIRLRESQVGSVSETTYSSLVGAFINDAKRVVEDAWQWDSLTTSASVSILTSSSGPYNLASSLNERARVYIDLTTGRPLARCTTTNFTGNKLVQVPQTKAFADKQLYNNTFPLEYYLDKGNSSTTSGQSRLRLYTINPSDGNYTFQLLFVNPQNTITDGSTVLSVPSDPVIQLAYLYALYERGEELGEMLTTTDKKASMALTDAIALDQASALTNLQFQVL